MKFYHADFFFRSLLFAAIFMSCSNSKSVDPPKPYGVLPSEAQIEWQKMEYYMFIHFGPNTFTDVEWGDGEEDPKVFNPSNVDCRQWAATAKAAGMKAIILTAKHHDGFCLWPSKYSTHTVAQSPWKDGKGDILKELSDACKEYGLKFGVYLSPWDQNHPAYGTEDYNKVFANTLDEVLGDYGEIFEQWFDGANGGHGHEGKAHKYDWELFHEVVYRHHPQAIIFSDVGPGCRWMGNERGVAGKTNWSRLNTKGFGPGNEAPPTDTLNIGNIHGEAWVPAETDVSIRPGWFYSASTNDKVKTLDQLLDIYYTSVGRNSNLLLNVPPDRTGRIHPNDSMRLMEFRGAIDKAFASNLTKGAKIKASSQRANSKEYKPQNLLDDNYDSYWASDDDVVTPWIEIDLNKNTQLNRILLQEYIPLGQRVSEFKVDAWIDNAWKEIASATTIGYKRILRFPSLETQKIRVSIQGSLASPILNNISLYMVPEKLSLPNISRDKAGMVSIVCATNDPQIYYTTDGSEPSVSSTLFTEPFALPLSGSVRALASITNGKITSESVSVVFDISPAKWSIVSPKNDRANRIIDGNDKSYAIVKNNEAVIINLGEMLSIKGFSYTPHSSEKANNIYKYNFYASEDGSTWTKLVSNGVFNNIKNNPIKQEQSFDKSITCKFIKIESLENVSNSKDYEIAQLAVITK